MKHKPDKTDYGRCADAGGAGPRGADPAGVAGAAERTGAALLVRLRADLVGSVRAVKTRILAVLRQQRIVEPCTDGGAARGWSWLNGGGCGLSEQGPLR